MVFCLVCGYLCARKHPGKIKRLWQKSCHTASHGGTPELDHPLCVAPLDEKWHEQDGCKILLPFNGKIDSVDDWHPSRILQALSLPILVERNVTQMQEQIKWHGGDVNGFAWLKNLKMEIAFPVLSTLTDA